MHHWNHSALVVGLVALSACGSKKGGEGKGFDGVEFGLVRVISTTTYLQHDAKTIKLHVNPSKKCLPERKDISATVNGKPMKLEGMGGVRTKTSMGPDHFPGIDSSCQAYELTAPREDVVPDAKGLVTFELGGGGETKRFIYEHLLEQRKLVPTTKAPLKVGEKASFELGLPGDDLEPMPGDAKICVGSTDTCKLDDKQSCASGTFVDRVIEITVPAEWTCLDKDKLRAKNIRLSRKGVECDAIATKCAVSYGDHFSSDEVSIVH